MTTVDGTRLYRDAIARIRQLEDLNAKLATEVDRMRPVVEAARTWWLSGYVQPKAIVLAEEIGRYAQRAAQTEAGKTK